VVVADHHTPDVVGEEAFQATHRLVVGLASGDLVVVIGPACTAAYPDLGKRDDM